MAKKKPLNQPPPPPLTLDEALAGYFQKCAEYRACIADGGRWSKLSELSHQIARFRKGARDQYAKNVKPRVLPDDWQPDHVAEFVEKYGVKEPA